MMKLFITGEKGFIAQNIIREVKDNFSSLEIVTGGVDYLNMHKPGEPCVFTNSIEQWEFFFRLNKIDVIIHNAAYVGTDVVALNAANSTRTNVEGTYNICRAAKKCDIPVCYMGTTVIYDTPKYQETKITEKSDHGPNTLYGCQKLSAEHIVKSQTSKWMIVRPLFAYGGEGDMNSLIAKSIYAALNKKEAIDMFLDPNKIKDYMHVSDYANAVLTAIQKDLWYDDWNVAAETPYSTSKIVNLIEEVCNLKLKHIINWYPQTDYMGNHRLDTAKFRNAADWKPRMSLSEGIRMSYKTIIKAKNYNPLAYLEEANKKGIDLTEFFNEDRITRTTI
jgi:nucleoside-diphosphate-sugar epimerase